LMDRLGVEEDEPIESAMLTRPLSLRRRKLKLGTLMHVNMCCNMMM